MNKKNVYQVLLVVIALSSLLLMFQAQTQAVTVQELVNSIIAHDNDIKTLKNDIERQKLTIQAKKSLYLPYISLRASQPYDVTQNQLDWNLSMNEVLYDSGERKAEITQAEKQLKISELQLTALTQELTAKALVSIQEMAIKTRICKVIGDFSTELIKYSKNPQYELYNTQWQSLDLYWKQNFKYIQESIYETTNVDLKSQNELFSIPEIPPYSDNLITTGVELSSKFKAYKIFPEMDRLQQKIQNSRNTSKLDLQWELGSYTLEENKSVIPDRVSLNYNVRLSKWFMLSYSYDFKNSIHGLNISLSRVLADESNLQNREPSINYENEVNEFKKTVSRNYDSLQLSELRKKELTLANKFLKNGYDFDPNPNSLMSLLDNEIGTYNLYLDEFTNKIELLKMLGLFPQYFASVKDVNIQ